jgi:hypothetical protein
MKLILLLVFTLSATFAIAQEQPPQKNNVNKPQLERKNIGQGKPRLFQKSSATSTATAPKPIRLNWEKVFSDSKAGDTLVFPYHDGDLKALVITRTRRNDQLTIMNLKVVNYQNSFMRLIRTHYDGKVEYHGLVHHPSYSDALELKSGKGDIFFEIKAQSDIINE